MRTLVSLIIVSVCSGETEANKARIIQGQLNVELSENGKRQAERLRNYHRRNDIKFDLVFSSDLDRAIDTCRAIIGHSLDIVVDSRLRERAFGVIEGQSIDKFRDEARRAGHSEENYSAFTPSGAETLTQVNNRVKDFCHNHLLRVVKPGFNVLIVTHGGVIREFMRFFRDNLHCYFSEREPLKVTPNTGVNLFKIEYSCDRLLKAICLKLHETSHLDDPTTAVVENEVSSRMAEVTYQSL
ncbi:phosphoglycerate mutase-like protein [Dinothrombium tinctorium]|uniref:Phosphoglycerate mutase-like protein n=1 Tax=Dinothrombium tinctorium TaxID=1965070 RepID=A0A3S3NZ05_9ACAR|nr:phosphoglycerate mutase-like protein [Dinothrombium tinctorium]RWS05904.1 phosphoglycerate mutase-like protein [Dinothrombium tinctorium]RWS11945.1 phosphoglycerate mutase-like protein [Dinothrombium tinctorium]